MSEIIRKDEPHRLDERVSKALSGNPYLSKRRKVSVTADAGRVVLRGTVNSFFQKQMAQEMIRDMEGVTEIENKLEVHWS